MREELGVGASEVEIMLSSLEYSKICARWVPRMLTQDQKDRWWVVCQDLLDRGHWTLDVDVVGLVGRCCHTLRIVLTWHRSTST